MADALSAEELRNRLDDPDDEFTVVDTREEESVRSWRVPGAVQYRFEPGGTLDPDDFRSETGLQQDDDIVTVCAKGVSSEEFADELERAGYESVAVVSEGMEGWSAVYDTVSVPVDGTPKITQFQRRAKGCLSYLLADPETGSAAVVDPTRHVEEFERVADERGYDVERVFDTHVHADHISGGRRLADRIDATYHLGERAAERDPRIEFDALGRNEVVSVGSVDIKTVATPGHTSEMVNYLVGSDALLTGDTLFVDSVGRTELQFDGREAEHGAQSLYESLHGTVLAEPDDVTVLPGHFPVEPGSANDVTPGTPVTTSVHDARTELSLLGLDETAFVEAVTSSLPEKPSGYETILDVNTGRRRLPVDEIANELEVGPNNCAATSD